MVDIPDVELKFLLPGEEVAAIDLRPAGKAWTDLVPAGLFVRIPRQIRYGQGTWPNEGHLAGEDEKELGELVKGRCAQDPAQTCEPLGVSPGAAAHGSKLKEAECFPVLARPILPEENGESLEDGHKNGNNPNGRQPDPGRQENEKDVNRPLHF